MFFIITLAVSALLVNPRREYDQNSRFYRFLLNSATFLCLKLGRVHVHAEGMEKLPEVGRFLLVCNHRSKFDPIITWYILRRYDLAFLSKAENFRVPIFGRLIRRCCFLAIDRENPRKAMETIRKAADLMENDEVSAAVYPEGTRSRTGELLPFHNGVFKIAKKAGTPIVVMTMEGAEDIRRNFPWRRSDVQLKILTVIPAEKVQEMGTAAISGIVRREMEKALS